jgi:ABC-2 family transporter protein
MIPIFWRELVTASRRERVHSQRGYFAGLLLAIVLGTFAAWYYWGNGQVSNVVMEEVAQRAFLLIVGVHAATMMGPVLVQATTAIAGEKDRRTLEFVLITRLTAAEIILEKLAARLVLFVTTIAAGLPVMLLLHLLGGIDVRVILLAYAGMATTAFFLASLSIWFSVTEPNARRAAGQGVSAAMMWLIGPTFLPLILPQFGWHLPAWAAAANAWLIASSPFGVMMKLAMGVGASAGLIYAVEWMSGLQMVGGVLLLVGSMIRLRPAYRANVSDETRARSLVGKGPVWRLRPRPAVGDDPILWREMYTSRDRGLAKGIGSLFNAGLLVLLAYATYHYARPALFEVWRHGYGAGVTSADRPEMNLFVGLFLGGSGLDQPEDAARIEFNLFLRWITVPIAMILVLALASTSCEVLTRERAKETWTSLLATPMTGHEIVRAAILATAWRLREFLTILLVLWTLGLIAGAIHPLGYLVSLLVLAASSWLLATWGIRAALQVMDQSRALSLSLNVALFSLLFSSALPFLLPSRFSSVLLGAGSHPFVLSLSLASYREVRAAFRFASYPMLQWLGIDTGEGPILVLATCVLGIVGPALGGWCCWRYALANFDRLVGRPWRAVPLDEHRPGVRREKHLGAADPEPTRRDFPQTVSG